MDREVNPNERRARFIRQGLSVGAAVVALGLAGSWGFGLMRPSLKRSQVRVATVDAGPVDSSLSASGTVVPEVGQVLSSPVDARVLKVLKRAGSPVKAGDPVLSLDISAAVLAVEKLAQDMALTANQRARSELALEGRVTDVLPTVQNGVVTVRVGLTDGSSPILRPNLRVEAFIVIGRRERALRVRKGPSTSGDGYQPVFVVRGDRAERVRVRFGIASFDFVEIVEGLSAGDEVIVSDMTDYQHLESIRLR